MPAEQICLFKFPRPLVDLFGPDFFKHLPAGPGVYIFRGEGRRVLYVGQSKNLRARLRYYKNAQPEREPRRIIRLVHQTREIEIRCFPSPAQAELEELTLIREHRPRFNVALTRSRSYSYFRVSGGHSAIRLSVSMDNPQPEEQDWTGAFRSHGLCRRALRALGRTLWLEHHRVASVYDFPLWLDERSRLLSLDLPVPEPGLFSRELRELIRGESISYLERVERRIHRTADACLKSALESDFLTLVLFSESAIRLRELRSAAGEEIVPQNRLDELLITNRRNRLTAAASRAIDPVQIQGTICA